MVDKEWRTSWDIWHRRIIHIMLVLLSNVTRMIEDVSIRFTEFGERDCLEHVEAAWMG